MFSCRAPNLATSSRCRRPARIASPWRATTTWRCAPPSSRSMTAARRSFAVARRMPTCSQRTYMANNSKLHILVTFALEPDLIDQIKAVDPRIEISVLGQDQRQLLRGYRYPSERERAAVAEGLQGAFAEADIVFGFWGAELHKAFTGEGSITDVAPHLKWIQLTSAGADRLLDSGFIEGGVTVTTVSGLHATPIGEYVLCQMLMFAKGASKFIRAQQKHEWVRYMPQELLGKTVGIVGMGHIGEEVARLAKPFGCRVIATRRSVTEPHSAGYADELMPS